MSTQTHSGPQPSSPMPAANPPQHRGRLGWIVAFSLAAGLTVALLMVAAPFVPVTAPAIGPITPPSLPIDEARPAPLARTELG